ncbi:MAG: TetR/AcrR family transcriptional regulator [Sphingomonadales bacterium]|nr:TetR/AcrR family transcriptional regulator [Sphingomonadales bacterium]
MTTVRRTQVERRSQSEAALLQAAVDLIAREGVGAVTFEALARVGGFSRGLASVRFGSKARLIEAVLAQLHERQEAKIAELGFEALPGREAILGYVDASLRDIGLRNEARAYFMLLSSAVAEASELRSAFAGTHAGVERRLARWVERGQADGTIRRDLDPQATGLMIGCLMFGQSMQLLVDPGVDCDRLREASVAMLRTTLAVP